MTFPDGRTSSLAALHLQTSACDPPADTLPSVNIKIFQLYWSVQGELPGQHWQSLPPSLDDQCLTVCTATQGSCRQSRLTSAKQGELSVLVQPQWLLCRPAAGCLSGDLANTVTAAQCSRWSKRSCCHCCIPADCRSRAGLGLLGCGSEGGKCADGCSLLQAAAFSSSTRAAGWGCNIAQHGRA